MKKYFIILFLIFNIIFISAQDAENSEKNNSEKKEKKGNRLTLEEYNEGMKKYKKFYNNDTQKLKGNIDVYYKIFDTMSTKGYINLNVNLVFEILDFKKLKSDKFNINFKAKDNMDFKYNKNFDFKREEIYVNKEGNGVFIVDFKLEKGLYKDIKISVNGNKGENASIDIDEYKLIDLSEETTKISDVILMNSLNTVRKKMFFRRNKYFIVPTLSQKYIKNRNFGFYFEYYHLHTDALYNEGDYRVKYSLTYMITDQEIYSKTEEEENVGENGQFLAFLNLSSAPQGIYKLYIEFQDYKSDKIISRTKYFIIENENKNNEDK